MRVFFVRCAVVLAVLAAVAGTTGAQSDTVSIAGRRPLLPRAREIALARSAAPPEISAQATVLVLTDTGYAIAERGTNDATCFVNRSQPESLEPHCFDREASATVMQVELRRGALRQQGRSAEEIERDIAEGIKSGRLALPRRPAMTYMMSSSQVLYSEKRARVGAWKPHIMLFIPYLQPADLGFGSKTPSDMAVVDAGTPLANLMIVLPQFARADSSTARP
jgi:hypothetical protein